MYLFESFGNFDKLDKSFFNNENPMVKYKAISPNSEIYVDKLKKEEGSDVAKHTWKYLTDVLLEDRNIAFIVIRSNKRQLLMITHNSSVSGRSDYVMKWSTIGSELEYVKSTISSNMFITSSDVTVRNKICKTVEAFIKENPNAKKNWDVIIVKTNEEKVDKYLKRHKSREGMELKPNHTEYNKYINELKSKLKERLVAYSESKLKDILSSGDMNDVLNNRTIFALPKLKIFNNIWKLYNSYSNITSDGKLIAHVVYKNPSMFNLKSNEKDISYLHIDFISNGSKVEIRNIGTSNYSNSTSEDIISFEEFLEKYRKYLA